MCCSKDYWVGDKRSQAHIPLMLYLIGSYKFRSEGALLHLIGPPHSYQEENFKTQKGRLALVYSIIRAKLHFLLPHQLFAPDNTNSKDYRLTQHP